MRFKILISLALSLTLLPPCFAEDMPAGVGLALRKEGANIVVSKVLPGTPAEKDGQVHEGDVIAAISQENDKPVKPDQITTAVGLLRGKQGTIVTPIQSQHA